MAGLGSTCTEAALCAPHPRAAPAPSPGSLLAGLNDDAWSVLRSAAPQAPPAGDQCLGARLAAPHRRAKPGRAPAEPLCFRTVLRRLLSHLPLLPPEARRWPPAPFAPSSPQDNENKTGVSRHLGLCHHPTHKAAAAPQDLQGLPIPAAIPQTPVGKSQQDGYPAGPESTGQEAHHGDPKIHIQQGPQHQHRAGQRATAELRAPWPGHTTCPGQQDGPRPSRAGIGEWAAGDENILEMAEAVAAQWCEGAHPRQSPERQLRWQASRHICFTTTEKLQ